MEIDALLEAARRHGKPISREQLGEVVGKCEKQRFAVDEAGGRIRANQGHSVEVDLQLEPAEPPGVLYHGTHGRVLDVIMREGLKKMDRHHVHLSVDVETAGKVGQRRGKAVILVVDAGAMRRDGFEFFVSNNGVWLVDAVPTKYLRRMD